MFVEDYNGWRLHWHGWYEPAHFVGVFSWWTAFRGEQMHSERVVIEGTDIPFRQKLAARDVGLDRLKQKLDAAV